MRGTPSTKLAIGLALALFPAMSAEAQTSDGVVPAQESACDVLVGGTPALYGLCIAYCTAQDLDTVDFTDPDSWKSAPSRAILDNYRSRMQPGDPDMPCLRTGCPCWTEEELDEAYPTTLSSFQCATDDGTMTNVSDGTIFNSPVDNSFEQRCQPYGYGYPIAWAAEFLEDDIRSCRLDQVDDGADLGVFFLITASEFELCKTSLRDHAASLGAECNALVGILWGSGETCDLHD